MFAFMFDAVFIGLLVPMFEFIAPAFEFIAAVAAGAGVLVLTGAGVALLTLTFALFAASPHAKPRALKPRTVESAITFFITVRLLSFSKIYWY